MKQLICGALALAGTAMPLPANAQLGFSFGEPRNRTYFEGDYKPDPRFDTQSRAGERRTCRTVRVRDGDHVRRVRRCS